MRTVLAITFVLVMVQPAHADRGKPVTAYCEMIRAAVAMFGRGAVERRARAMGVTAAKIREGRACLSASAKN